MYRKSIYQDLAENFVLHSLPHHFKVANVYYETKKFRMRATADLYVRELPKHRNFLVAGGINEIIELVKNLRYTKEQIDILVKEKVITKEFSKVLSKLKFTGDLWALPEGTIFFPNEPVVRITAPIMQITLITDLIMSILCADTIIFSKLARLKLVSQGKTCSICSVRAQSPDVGMRVQKYAEVLDLSRANCLSFKTFNLPTNGIAVAYHAFIKSFPTELEAMRAFTEVFPQKGSSVMIDTYDFKEGLKNAITVAKELKEKGHSLGSITIDSGDLEKRSKYVRKKLDQAKLKDVKITIASNLDEYKLKELLKKKTPFDTALFVTEIVTSPDAPKLEVIYKLSERIYGREITPVMKLAKDKTSLPGRKQVFRQYLNGRIDKDIIGLDKEKLGTPLLKEYIRKGKSVRKLPTLKETNKHVIKELNSLPLFLRTLKTNHNYKAYLSKELRLLINKTRKELLKN